MFIRRASWPAPKIAIAASGVPKVGAPDCIDSVETKVPNTTGAPGRVSWQNAAPAITSASTCVSVPATVTGFGAVFSDVDRPNGNGTLGLGKLLASAFIEYFDRNGRLIFSSFVPAAPGDGNLSFFAIKFDDARIASIRIKTGNVAPGPNDDEHHDIVMMDDFIYGEPQLLQ